MTNDKDVPKSDPAESAGTKKAWTGLTVNKLSLGSTLGGGKGGNYSDAYGAQS